MNFSRYIVLALKGCAMGMADVVPGVSGGTIAFISGIYEELLDSIRSVNATALKLLLKLRLGEFWRHINGSFLLPVLLGIATVILILLCQYFWPGGVQPGGVVLCIVLYSTPVETYVSYALNRILDTTIGVIVALLVNYFLPRERVVALWEGFKKRIGAAK